MKKILNFVTKHQLVISLLFVLMAVLTCGTGLLITAAEAGGDPPVAPRLDVVVLPMKSMTLTW